MNLASPMQSFQDWFTQQWVIIWGRKIEPADYLWLFGPFGSLNGIGEDFIYQLAERENLIVERNSESRGILPSISHLNLSAEELGKLSEKVIDFYEKTSDYQLNFNVKWNPLFRFFGFLVNRMFSARINQLNIPTRNSKESEAISSEIIRLLSSTDHQVKYTIWLRKYPISGKVIYSGIYSTCTIPSGATCVKAIFPLPKGNATVIMTPSVGADKDFILDSSGKVFGDAGFYFLLNDRKGSCWAQFISSFEDRLTIKEEFGFLKATQKLKLWKKHVATFSYEIKKLHRKF